MLHKRWSFECPVYHIFTQSCTGYIARKCQPTFPRHISEFNICISLNYLLENFENVMKYAFSPEKECTINPNTHVYVCVYVSTQLCLAICDPMDCSPPGSSVHGNSPGKNTGVGCHALLQGIFLTLGSNLHCQHCRQILYS